MPRLIHEGDGAAKRAPAIHIHWIPCIRCKESHGRAHRARDLMAEHHRPGTRELCTGSTILWAEHYEAAVEAAKPQPVRIGNVTYLEAWKAANAGRK